MSDSSLQKTSPGTRRITAKNSSRPVDRLQLSRQVEFVADKIINRGSSGKEKPSLTFKVEYSYEKRREVSGKIRDKYPNRIPVIFEKSLASKLPSLPKRKYLVPDTMLVSQFIADVRKHMVIKPSDAIFIFVNNTLPSISMTIGQIYEKHQDEDGFLYMIYNGENAFG